MYLLVPLHSAFTADYVLHFFLFSVFMFVLARQWNISPAGSFLTAVLMTFSSPHFLSLYWGHLTIITAIAWTPLLLLIAHKLLLSPQKGTWFLMGAFASGLQVLSGHPQVVYNTHLFCGLYLLISGIHMARPKNSKPEIDTLQYKDIFRTLALWIVMVLLGFGLGGYQIAAGIAAVKGTVREGGYTLEEARSFSPHIETFLTFLFPEIFGNSDTVAFWARGTLKNFYCGISSIFFALIAIGWGKTKWRSPALLLMLIAFVFTCLSHFPLLTPVYYGVPFFKQFRYYDRFFFFVALFLTLLAGVGFDTILKLGGARRHEIGTRSATKPSLEHRFSYFLIGGVCIGVILVMCSIAVNVIHIVEQEQVLSSWRGLIDYYRSHYQGFSYLSRLNITGDFYANSLDLVLSSLQQSGGILVLLCILVIALKKVRLRLKRIVAIIIVLVAVGDIASFSCTFLRFFPLGDAYFSPGAHRYLQRKVKENDRCIMFFETHENMLMHENIPCIWGYDQFAPERIVRFIHRSQEELGDLVLIDSGDRLTFESFKNIYRMLRVSHLIVLNSYIPPDLDAGFTGEYFNIYPSPYPPFPEAQLYTNWRSVTSFEQGLDIMFSGEVLDLDREVLIEGTLTFPSGDTTTQAPGKPDRARVVDRGVNYLEIEANVTSNTVLLVTDVFYHGWHVKDLLNNDSEVGADSTSRDYNIVPGNSTLRAIGLGAGRHHLQIHYYPGELKWGAVVNITALLLFIILLCFLIYRHNKKKNTVKQKE